MHFFSGMQKTHIKTSSEKCLLCHKRIVLYTLYLKSSTYPVIFSLQENVGRPSSDPGLLFKLPITVQETRHRQACRQRGEMESKLNHESAGLGWNPQAGRFAFPESLLRDCQGPSWLLEPSGRSGGT